MCIVRDLSCYVGQLSNQTWFDEFFCNLTFDAFLLCIVGNSKHITRTCEAYSFFERTEQIWWTALSFDTDFSFAITNHF